MTFLCCEHTKRISRFFKKCNPVHGQKVLPGADLPWPNEKVKSLSNNTLANDSEMSSSALTSTSTSVVVLPPYREKSESLKPFEVVHNPAPHDQ
ncbi:hypothetical protein BGZ47_005884 [Haplosporangium gracile]|nr:hypothetical protein BGZ47_005884 [Haplosporangium gracile]